ncbi:hypothetical protein CUMW_282860 [Citrus unshiu]|uniref:Uncharacterized protein n=1 Tax=Citrus unshiu TaxID=55188 RepID=A0A2H5N4C3_CITUN|nr:hypothetical protein CUMW_282860 [Citrus unshiu]
MSLICYIGIRDQMCLCSNRHPIERIGGLQPLCGIGVTSRTKFKRIPLLRIARNAASLPRPGPFIMTSARCIP